MGPELEALAEELIRMSEKLGDLFDYLINERIGNDESLSIHKCGICLEFKQLDECIINSPCGHIFCETVSFFNFKISKLNLLSVLGSNR